MHNYRAFLKKLLLGKTKIQQKHVLMNILDHIHIYFKNCFHLFREFVTQFPNSIKLFKSTDDC